MSRNTSNVDVALAARKARSSVEQSIASLNSVFATRASTVDPLGTMPSLDAGLYDGFRSLLSTLRHATTSLSLAFKPPITPDAALQQLERLEKTFGQCGTCVLAAAGETEGGKNSLLVEEWKEGVLEIGEAVRRYLLVLEDSAKTGAGPSGTSSSGTEASNGDAGAYLVQTGAVWESIDRMMAATPASEIDAFRKRWEGQRGVMKDAWEEFKEFLEDAEEDDDAEEGESDRDDDLDEDDEWAELERGLSGGKLLPEERKRAELAKNALALHQILHSSLPRFFNDLPSKAHSAFRPLLAASSAQVAAFDTAIDSLYPEQDPKAIDEAMSGLHAASTALAVAFKGQLAAENAIPDTFIARWLAKASEEREKWSNTRLSLASLREALP